ncbi:MAG: hypothetical protein ABW234_07355 [Actinomycetes bacterium]|jgi:hypothetical protein
MQRTRRWLVLAGLLAAGLQLSACTQQAAEAEGATNEPAKIEQVAGGEVSRLTLTARAAERLGIQTAPVRKVTVEGQARTVVPYGAVLYDAKGRTWVYVAREPLSYLRERITVDDIEDDRAVLTGGPAAGTAVVSVGAAELYGTEFGVGH